MIPLFEIFCMEEEFLFESVMIFEKSKIERKSGKVIYRGEIFNGLNKPKRYRGEGLFKYRVLAYENGKYAILNFGNKNYKDFLQHKDPERRKNFRSRMNCDKKHSKLTKKYWVCNYNW